MEDLKNKKCVPCEGGVEPFDSKRISYYINAVPGWQVIDDEKKIERDHKFKHFADAIDFINKVAKLAEAEGHHPDILLHDWNRVKLTLWTHAIGGLHENDFILAVKIDLIDLL